MISWALLARLIRWKILICMCFVVFRNSLRTYNKPYDQGKTSLQSMGSATINGPLLPTPPLALVGERQPFGNWHRNRGKFHEGWRPKNGNNRGNKSATSRSDFYRFNGLSRNDGRQDNWQRNRGHLAPSQWTNTRCHLCQAFNHTAPHCPQLQNIGYGQQPSTNQALSSASLAGTADWLPNTNANQHVVVTHFWVPIQKIRKYKKIFGRNKK